MAKELIITGVLYSIPALLPVLEGLSQSNEKTA